jgi:MAD, mothers against decapentaplegic interacting protein
VYGDIGHTVMSLLCDVRNFQYTIPQIDGLSIQMNGLHTRIIIPESQYDLIVKSLLTSNDYVFSLGLLQIDDACASHLVAIENENLGSYASKTFNYNPETQEEFNLPQLTNKS